MITVQKAREYANLLHPAFAGYYHDGLIQESDGLATVFHLIKSGYIEPEFTDNNINKGISYLRRNARKPPHKFEQTIIDQIFRDTSRVSTHFVGDLIKHHVIQSIIAPAATTNYNTIIPPHKNSLSKHVKHTIVNKDGKRLINVVISKRQPFIFLSLFAALLALRSRYIDQDPLLTNISIIAAIVLFLLFIFDRWPGDTISSHVIADQYSQYYSDLYEFLKAHPPQPHTFTYEFIPYAIAFNIDTSWHQDFNLIPEE